MVWQAVRRIRSDQGHAEMGRSDRRRIPRTADHPRAPEKTRHTGRRRDQLPVSDGTRSAGMVQSAVKKYKRYQEAWGFSLRLFLLPFDYGYQTVIIVGDRYRYGNDEDEIIIENAEVIGIA